MDRTRLLKVTAFSINASMSNQRMIIKAEARAAKWEVVAVTRVAITEVTTITITS